jgi:hypothetical protein
MFLIYHKHLLKTRGASCSADCSDAFRQLSRCVQKKIALFRESGASRILLTSSKCVGKNAKIFASDGQNHKMTQNGKGVIPMVCTTVKESLECIFMTKKGCSFNGGGCHPIVEDCHGCNRASEFSSGWYCTACPDPSVKWKNGDCNFATHVTKETQVKNAKINPLKASKRKGR